MQHGLDLRNGYYAEQYVSKWGIEDEITKGNIKKGRNGSYSPFDLLQLSITDEIVHGRSAAKLFQEFAISMKGARQLEWGRGLRNFLEMEQEKSDQELAEETDKASITLTPVEDLIFHLLCKFQKRHEYLEAVQQDYENGCFGNGSAERLIQRIAEIEIKELQNAY